MAMLRPVSTMSNEPMFLRPRRCAKLLQFAKLYGHEAACVMLQQLATNLQGATLPEALESLHKNTPVVKDSAPA